VLTALLLTFALSGVALAQCGCEPEPVVGDPECYAGFYVGNPILFKLVVPADFFMECPGCPVPAIIGWRVETADGTVVFEQSYIEPKGHYHEMTWTQHDTWGNPVPTGYYKLVIATDSAGEVAHFVNIQQRPCLAWPCWCGCWGCCPILESVPCCVPYGMIYLSILNGPTASQPYITVHVSIVQSGSSMP
jgi:hypothetical protein